MSKQTKTETCNKAIAYWAKLADSVASAAKMTEEEKQSYRNYVKQERRRVCM